MTLFTTKGDDGMTSVFSGSRISKTSLHIECLGSLDELNSYLGVCKAYTSNRGMRRIVESLQETLFIIQAEVAGAEKKIDPKKVNEIEDICKALERRMQPISSFLIPGATCLSAHFDVARTLARRAERNICSLKEEQNDLIGAGTVAYLNRLSSVLYGLARYSAQRNGKRENAPTYE